MIQTERLRELMINDNGFAFDPATGFTYNISLVGIEIVRHLKQGLQDDDLTERLLDDYAVDRDTARRDVETFLDALVKYGLARREQEANA